MMGDVCYEVPYLKVHVFSANVTDSLKIALIFVLTSLHNIYKTCGGVENSSRKYFSLTWWVRVLENT